MKVQVKMRKEMKVQVKISIEIKTSESLYFNGFNNEGKKTFISNWSARAVLPWGAEYAETSFDVYYVTEAEAIKAIKKLIKRREQRELGE